MTLLMNKPHWSVNGHFGVLDLEVFFTALPTLFPSGGKLTLHNSNFDGSLRLLVRDDAIDHERGGWLAVHEHFTFELSPRIVATLASFAANHPEPMVAEVIRVHRDEELLLEWLDVPDNSVSISLNVPEENVRAFTDLLSVNFASYERHDGS